ncbi:hypothetical protein QFZ48_005787 [Chitinophaga sp. W2I13]
MALPFFSSTVLGSINMSRMPGYTDIGYHFNPGPAAPKSDIVHGECMGSPWGVHANSIKTAWMIHDIPMFDPWMKHPGNNRVPKDFYLTVILNTK